MEKLIYPVCLLFILFLSCKKESLIKKSEGLVISTGTICGWCGGADSLRISEEIIFYHLNTPCDNNDFYCDSATNRSEWNELTALLDLDEFQNIEINTCYVCADGCDTWISVNGDSYSHTIRFGMQDSIAIQSIKPFADMLKTILNRFRDLKT
jgi:hypothetical protein